MDWFPRIRLRKIYEAIESEKIALWELYRRDAFLRKKMGLDDFIVQQGLHGKLALLYQQADKIARLCR